MERQPHRQLNHQNPFRTPPQIKRGPLSGPSKALGMVGCLQGKTAPL
jgi:hypothetical protein